MKHKKRMSKSKIQKKKNNKIKNKTTNLADQT